jgi:hypothetical protein
MEYSASIKLVRHEGFYVEPICEFLGIEFTDEARNFLLENTSVGEFDKKIGRFYEKKFSRAYKFMAIEN